MNLIAALNGPQTPPPGSAINTAAATAIDRERVKDRLSEQGLLLRLVGTVLIGTAGAIVGSVTS